MLLGKLVCERTHEFVGKLFLSLSTPTPTYIYIYMAGRLDSPAKIKAFPSVEF